MSRRKSWGVALKDAAIKFAREAERYVGANDAEPCLCEHPRSAHCGCGMHCFGPHEDGSVPCKCQGFAPKPEPQPA